MNSHLRNLSLFLIISLLLTGCWDRRELEERSLVAAVAIDRDPEGYKLSFQVPIPIKIVGSGGGGGEGGQEVVQVFSATGKTVTQAFTKIKEQANQELFYGYTVLLIFSEELLQEGIERHLDIFRRNPIIRRRLRPIVVKGKAEDLLKSNPKLEQIPATYIFSLIENGVRDGWMADVALGDLFSNISNPGKNGIINMLEAKKDTARWIGLAALKRDRMIGSLTDYESDILLQIRAGQQGSPITTSCPDEKGEFVFAARSVNPKIEIVENERVKIRVTVDVEGEVIEKECISNITNPGVLKRMEAPVRSLYERRARELIHKVQTEFQSDIFLFGNRIRAYHPELWRRINWVEEFPRTEIDVRYQVKVQRYGMESR